MLCCNTLASSVTPRFLVSYLALSFIVLFGCNIPSTRTQERVAEHYIPDPGSVGFDIEPVKLDNSSQQWLATYSSQGKIAKFRIELGATKSLSDKESRDFDIEQGEGSFIAEPGSDASILLADLKKALEAKKLPSKVQKVRSLPFTFVSLGKNQSQASDGGFNARPPGNWTPMKIFIGEGEKEGDVFLNLNPVIKKGQFSIKDSDYGDAVLAHLARVL
jgi:hypothetical protein